MHEWIDAAHVFLSESSSAIQCILLHGKPTLTKLTPRIPVDRNKTIIILRFMYTGSLQRCFLRITHWPLTRSTFGSRQYFIRRRRASSTIYNEMNKKYTFCRNKIKGLSTKRITQNNKSRDIYSISLTTLTHIPRL
jgi:hypothetical protein